MDIIYTGNLGQKLFLYTNENFIYLRTAIGADISRLILLADDYKDGLTSTIFQNSIHFAYRNIHGDLLIRNILDSHILFSLSSDNSPDYTSPKLLTLQDKLLLFYFVKNPLNETYLLRVLCPFEEAKPKWSPLPFSSLPNINFVNLGNQMLLVCLESGKASFYQIAKDCSYEMLSLLTSDIKHQNEMLLQSKDKLIESIKGQYEELKNTAIAYRNEAAKWYNKYYSERESV